MLKFTNLVLGTDHIHDKENAQTKQVRAWLQAGNGDEEQSSQDNARCNLRKQLGFFFVFVLKRQRSMYCGGTYIFLGCFLLALDFAVATKLRGWRKAVL